MVIPGERFLPTNVNIVLTDKKKPLKCKHLIIIWMKYIQWNSLVLYWNKFIQVANSLEWNTVIFNCMLE